MTAHDPRVTLTEAEREVIWAGLRRARREEAPIPLAHEFHKTHVLWAVGPAVEQIVAARLAPIRALAEEWEQPDVWQKPLAWWWESATRLLAALDATGANLSASQDHDGAEGQP